MKMPHVAREEETNDKTWVQKRKVKLCSAVTQMNSGTGTELGSEV